MVKYASAKTTGVVTLRLKGMNLGGDQVYMVTSDIIDARSCSVSRVTLESECCLANNALVAARPIRPKVVVLMKLDLPASTPAWAGVNRSLSTALRSVHDNVLSLDSFGATVTPLSDT